MWSSSLCLVVPSWNVTGSFPMGLIFVPLTALGMILEGRRLSTCSPSSLSACVPAADMSAPESGKLSRYVAPLREVMWMGIVGAGSVTWVALMFHRRARGGLVSPTGLTQMVLVDGWGFMVV